MRRQFVLIAGIVAAFLTADLAYAQHAKAIKIGEINSYSILPEFAGPYRNGWRLAVEEINAADGIDGRRIEVISRDDGGNQSTAVRYAKQLIEDDKVDILAGTYLSNIGLAVSAVAARHKTLFLASEPLTDAITWDKGNRYTFRLRPSTYMQAAMLVEQAAKLPARRWAILAPNYEYGQSAAASFKLLLKTRHPDIEFVSEQWPALGKIDAGKVVEAFVQAKPDAIFNATFGPDLVKFAHEGKRRGLFAKSALVGMLSGEPENLDMLKGDTPKGAIVTGYPQEQINTPEHAHFLDAYTRKYHEPPRLGSVVGYTSIIAIAEAVRKAGSTDSEKLVSAMRTLHLMSPLGPIAFRAIDQQSTMGAYVGTLDLHDGNGVMVDWHYADGEKYLPDDAYVKTRRPASAMK